MGSEEIEGLVPREPVKCATEAVYSNPPRGKALRRPKMDSIPKSCDHSDNTSSYNLNLSQSDAEFVRRMSSRPRLTATVNPFHCSRGVQTDALAIDMEALCPLDDFRRSERITGLRCEGDKTTRLAIAEAKVDSLQSQVDNLQAQLRGQQHIHDDLKMLLVGSLGDDAAKQLFQLTSERIRLTEENNKLRQQIHSLTDQLDRVNIEADMWRSKFIAGRAMLDELAGWKAQLSVRYQESLHAVRQLLQERQQIRNDLCEIHRLFASHHPHMAKEFAACATNTVELAIANRQLARSVFKQETAVNPASPPIRLEYCREYTTGERSAIDVLGNQLTFSADITLKYPSAFQSSESKTFERVTLGSCRKCKGDVDVV